LQTIENIKVDKSVK